MVAELTEAMNAMKVQMEKMEYKIDERTTSEGMEAMNQKFVRRFEELEDKLKVLDVIKDDFGDKLKKKLADMEVAIDLLQKDTIKNMTQLHPDAQAKFNEVGAQNIQAMTTLTQYEIDMKAKFDEVAKFVIEMKTEAYNKYAELEENIRKGGVGHNRDNKKGFLPDKMMIPKKFKDDISIWRKWKQEVTKYFDEGKEGLKLIMDSWGSPTSR